MQSLLGTWMGERFLHRIAASGHRRDFVLKGGHLLTVWDGDLVRSTRDVDLHCTREMERAEVEAAFGAVASIQLDDGTRYDSGPPEFEFDTAGCPRGFRIRVPAVLGSARIKLKVDVIFDQPIVPGPELRWHQGLHDRGAPARLACSPKETMLAEKLAIAVEFGADNNRIRDFFDLWHLIGRHTLNGGLMQEAVVRTFSSRNAGRLLQRDDGIWAAGFVPGFATPSLGPAWRSFGKQHAPRQQLPHFDDVVSAVSRFAIPLLRSVRDAFVLGPWSPVTGWKVGRTHMRRPRG